MARQDENNKWSTTTTVTLSGIVSIVGLVAAGVTSYNAIQNDIAALKRGEIYQERVNDQNREEFKSIRADIKELGLEQHTAMREFGEKVDTLIEIWPHARRHSK